MKSLSLGTRPLRGHGAFMFTVHMLCAGFWRVALAVSLLTVGWLLVHGALD